MATSNKSSHVIQLKDVKFLSTKLIVTFRSFKHNKSKPVSIMIQSQSNSKYCPVQALSQFLQLRGNKPGPLFMFLDNVAIPQSFFATHLKNSLAWAKLDNKLYKAHSFRIGAATEAAQRGLSEHRIKLMGRWKSDAYKKYIRISMLN